MHAFAFSGTGERKMLLSESEGKFSYEEWNEACQMAEEACRGDNDDDEDEGGVRLEAGGEAMDIDAQAEGEHLEKWLRSVVRRKVEYEQRWKSAT
jgi:exosome complex component RRP46